MEVLLCSKSDLRRIVQGKKRRSTCSVMYWGTHQGKGGVTLRRPGWSSNTTHHLQISAASAESQRKGGVFFLSRPLSEEQSVTGLYILFKSWEDETQGGQVCACVPPFLSLSLGRFVIPRVGFGRAEIHRTDGRIRYLYAKAAVR